MGKDYLGISLYTSGAVLLFLALVTTSLRCYVRIRIVKVFGLDDWLMVLAMAFYSVYCGILFRGTSLDFGLPTIEIPLDDIVPALQAFYFGEIFYILTVCAIKLSIGAFLIRITQARIQIFTIYACLFLVLVYTIAFIFMTIFQCTPITHFWERASPGTCFRPAIILGTTYAHAVIIAGTDLIFALLPIFLVWNLQMNRFMKFSVAGLMSLGAIAGITTIARVPYIHQLTTSANFFQATAKLAIMTSVEPGLGITIGSAAALRPLFKSLISKTTLFSSPRSRSRSRSRSRNTRSQMKNSIKVRPWRSEQGPQRLDSFDAQNAKEMTTVVIEGGKGGLCRNCGGSCERSVSGRSGKSGSSEDYKKLTFDGHIPDENGIYKEMMISRTVEFVEDKV